MSENSAKRSSFSARLVVSAAALSVLGFALTAVATKPSNDTATPIKHVIVIIGENGTFDSVFGAYQPRTGQTVSNLLSKGIIKEDGTPGPNFSSAAQFTATGPGTYFISSNKKTPYSALPSPDVNNAPNAPSMASLPFPPATPSFLLGAIEPGLEAGDLGLLTTGATGAPGTKGVDLRVTNATHLPNGPFQITGPTLPFDSYTGDNIHRFYQMWQQSDCSMQNATQRNPVGCLSDLYPFVNTTLSTADYGGGNSMGFFNVHTGDAPFLKKLADEFTLSDNYHQPVMGGTATQHVMLGTGDALFWSDGHGNAATPSGAIADTSIANPNPTMVDTNLYTVDGNWSNCSDPTQPGVRPIMSYLQTLPYEAEPNCEPGHYYMLNNTNPGFLTNGQPNPDPSVPPSPVRTIGDALLEKHISWRYYGGAFTANLKGLPLGLAYCAICNPFQYATSIMTNDPVRIEHLKDVTDLFGDISAGTLPAVSIVKPDGIVDGHPATSKLDLFEAFVKDILDRLQNDDPAQFAETAVIVTFDEGGGFYDSGFIQPIDFFGDGPRIPAIVVSPFSKGGRVVHTYYDHVSILKFIERNWGLDPLTARSRDNLPNPQTHEHNPYVPVNAPAIGDLFDMFDFAGKGIKQGEAKQEAGE